VCDAERDDIDLMAVAADSWNVVNREVPEQVGQTLLTSGHSVSKQSYSTWNCDQDPPL
jgi:hypothetical protein